MRAKKAYIEGSIEYEDYINSVRQHMAGKGGGAVRSMNNLTVQGSL